MKLYVQEFYYGLSRTLIQFFNWTGLTGAAHEYVRKFMTVRGILRRLRRVSCQIIQKEKSNRTFHVKNSFTTESRAADGIITRKATLRKRPST